MIITKEIQIDYGHTLPNHYSFCNQIHGHRGRIVGYFSGNIRKDKGDSSQGMVVDFNVCKEALMKVHKLLDHGFAVWKEAGEDIVQVKIKNGTMVSLSMLDFILSRNTKVLLCDVPPTAEYLAYWAFTEVNNALYELYNSKQRNHYVILEKLEWWETPNNRAIIERGEWLDNVKIVPENDLSVKISVDERVVKSGFEKDIEKP